VSYTNAHLSIRLNGGFGGSVSNLVDKWSSGFRIAVPGADIVLATPALLTLANAIHAAAVTMHSATGFNTGTSCFFTHVTAARVGTDGKYNPPGQLTVQSTGSPQAGVGSATFPWNTALAAGLRTSAPRGYASNGRFYYPMIAGALTAATGRVTSTTQDARNSVMKTFFNTVNTAANVYDPGAVVCVMSNVGSGTTARVLAVRTDDRLDSIERRENGAPPSYRTLLL
jgi:hypothetical protein